VGGGAIDVGWWWGGGTWGAVGGQSFPTLPGHELATGTAAVDAAADVTETVAQSSKSDDRL
jgi:hypothetical protein